MDFRLEFSDRLLENEAFGTRQDAYEQIVEEIAPDAASDQADRVILDLARIDFVRAIDLIWSAAAFTKPEASLDVTNEVAVLARRAVAYAATQPGRCPEWAEERHLTNDDQFLDAFKAKLKESDGTAVEMFGGSPTWDHLKAAAAGVGVAARNLTQAGAARLKQAAADLGGRASEATINPFVRMGRPWAHRNVSRFLGDVFAYIAGRGEPGKEGPIVKMVADALQTGADATKAANDAGKSDPLIVIGHSMGGNIVYDILTAYRPSLTCDLFVTIGSQVGLFEELRLFRASDWSRPASPGRPAPGELVPTTPNIKRWLNVFDLSDVLGYSTARIFERSQDFAFVTQTVATSAHSMYFYRPQFHERLRKRVSEALR